MKKLICITVLAVACMAQAKTWSMPNRAGGKIVLTDRECATEPALREMFAYADEGSVRSGCWAFLDNMVRVRWSNGQQSAFDAANFKAEPVSDVKPKASQTY